VNVASKLTVFVISQNGKNKYDVNNTSIHLFSMVRPVEGIKVYIEYQSSCPLVGIGSPTPYPGNECGLPGHKRGEPHSLAGEGVGGPIPTKGQKLWYSMFTIITLGLRVYRKKDLQSIVY
jgi:hypothetical protein